MSTSIINKSDSITEIIKGLHYFQINSKTLEKNADNPFFKSKYTTLDEVTEAIKSLQDQTGLCYMQVPNGDGSTVQLSTILLHVSGEFIEFVSIGAQLPKEVKEFTDRDGIKKTIIKGNSQEVGSAITYLKRYALCSIFGLASKDDDDGNGAVGNNQGSYKVDHSQKQQAQKGKQQNTKFIEYDFPPELQKANKLQDVITANEVKRLWVAAKGDEDLVRGIIKKYNYESTKAIKLSDFAKIYGEINKLKTLELKTAEG